MVDNPAAVIKQLLVTQERLRAAYAAHAAPPRDEVGNTLFSSTPEIATAPTPISWLCERLELGATEEQILWTLIAHELCPTSRQLVRELNTEQVADPTLDTIRRVVYGSIPDPRAWIELAAEGSLRRLGLVERSVRVIANPNDHAPTIITKDEAGRVRVTGDEDWLAKIAAKHGDGVETRQESAAAIGGRVVVQSLLGYSLESQGITKKKIDHDDARSR